MQARYFLIMLLAAFVAVPFASSSAALTATTFGPKQFVRTPGPPATYTEIPR